MTTKQHSVTNTLFDLLQNEDLQLIKPCVLFSHPAKLSFDGQFCYFAANPTDSIKESDLSKLKIKLKQTRYRTQDSGLTSGWIGYLSYPRDSTCDFELHYYPWVIQINNLTAEVKLCGKPDKAAQELLLKLKNTPTPSPVANPKHTLSCSKFSYTWTPTQYKQAFHTVQSYLKAGDCYQINLTQPATAHYQGNPKDAASALFEQLTPSFGCYFEGTDKTLISLSPERLVKITPEGRMEAKPIKGTIKKGDTADTDIIQRHSLINSAKDQAENLMIVDLLRNDLGHSAKPGSVNVDKLFELESHPYVHHLVSTISAELKEDIDPIDALLNIFPGGSITGAPKKRAMEIIDELEAQPRSLYCGSFGYISDNGEIDFNILIRSLEFKNGEVTCWGGGGITIDSNIEDEYQESLTKTEKIREILESF